MRILYSAKYRTAKHVVDDIIKTRQIICPVAKSLTTRQSLIAFCFAAYFVLVCMFLVSVTSFL